MGGHDRLPISRHGSFNRRQRFRKTATKASGGKERILHVGSNPAYLAGNRFGLPDQLPASYDAIQDAITQAESGSESQQPTT